MRHIHSITGLIVTACVVGSGAQAQDAPRGDNAFGDIAGRWYVSPLYSATRADDHRETDDGAGGTIAIGKNVNRYFNFELYGFMTEYDAKTSADDKAKLEGVGLAAYGFPFGTRTDGVGRWLGGAYGLVGVAYGNGKDFPERPGKFDVDGDRFLLDAGVGYLARIPFVRFASLRLDARYRLDINHAPYAAIDGNDNGNDRPTLEDVVFSAGLLIPIGSAPQPAAAPAPPVAVVAPAAICSDTLDNDGDGLTDFPGDPGCTAADDGDETDPPQCSNGKDDDGDGLVDFPADKGCTAADDNDEVDPCKTPAPGERVSLKGCGTGDVIVLRGVNFEFDKSTLTVNARTILDNVAEELAAYPDIKVEVGGHTDAKGADEYNQKLSERRAAAVVKYLAGKGVAAERMTSAGYGEAKPVADNETDEGRELNRRVELKVQ